MPGNQISAFWMLPTESITFSDNSILFHVLAGATDGSPVTGYLGVGADHARYEIGDLAVTGFNIIGISTSSDAGIASGLAASLIGGHEVDFDLSSLAFSSNASFTDVNGYQFADARVDLSLQPVVTAVPEPSTFALFALALVALRFAHPRSQRG